MPSTFRLRYKLSARPLFTLLAFFCLFLSIGLRPAQAQSFLIDVDEPFTEIAAQISAGEADAAERTLNAIPASSRNGDYHYLRGVLAMEAMNEAGTFQMARLARRMRGHFEDAVEADPDHALAHFGLMQFHRFAPGIMGGRKRDLEFHHQRLLELDSFLQFPAALIKAQEEEDQQAQKAIYDSWIAHSPSMFEAHYSYLSSLISWAEYEQAKSAVEQALRYANDTQTQLVEYQQVRLAALFSMAEYDKDQASSENWRSSAWLAQAHATGVALLESEQLTEQIDDAWLQMRLAQVEWALLDTTSALARLELVRSSEADERLLSEADTLQARINQG